MLETIIILGIIVSMVFAGAEILVVVARFHEDVKAHPAIGWFFSVCFIMSILLLTLMMIDYYCIIFGIEDVFELRD